MENKIDDSEVVQHEFNDNSIRKPWGFCETPEEKCNMNYCDENGCQNRTRHLVEDSELKEKEKKYRIVNSEDRLPAKHGQYYTSNGLLYFYFTKGKGNFWDENDDHELYPHFWLEEIESYEFEILEKLQESTEVIKWYMENSTSELPEPFFNIGANQIEQNEKLIKEATEL